MCLPNSSPKLKYFLCPSLSLISPWLYADENLFIDHAEVLQLTYCLPEPSFKSEGNLCRIIFVSSFLVVVWLYFYCCSWHHQVGDTDTQDCWHPLTFHWPYSSSVSSPWIQPLCPQPIWLWISFPGRCTGEHIAPQFASSNRSVFAKVSASQQQGFSRYSQCRDPPLDWLLAAVGSREWVSSSTMTFSRLSRLFSQKSLLAAGTLSIPVFLH